MSILVLVRHGQSEWNAQNLFTGWRDAPLSAQGITEAKQAGELLKTRNIVFDVVFTSALARAQDTAQLILHELGQEDLPIHKDAALNERHYGDLAGLNKDDARKKWGEEQVHIWRRSYDIAPPNGESLKDTAQRVLPYWSGQIVPLLSAGKSALISAHGNSLRALVMALEQLSPAEITQREIPTGQPLFYSYENEAVQALP